MSLVASVECDERLRLFLALRLPEHVLDRIAAWQELELASAGRAVSGLAASGRAASGRIVPRDHLHVTLAFIGSRPSRELDEIVAALDSAARAADSIEFELERYRETRAVGMLVLRDRTGAAAALAGNLHARLEALGVYRRENRPWLPHLTVVRFGARSRVEPQPPRLGPPQLGVFAPSDAAAFLSRLHPSGARYEVLDTCALQALK